MKAKFLLEEKSRQAMPWSKVVKRPHLTGKEVKRYLLEEVAFTEGASTEETSKVPLSPLKQEYAKGFEEGEAKGLQEGYAKGFAEGEAKGLQEGETRGSEIREEELCEYENTHQLLLRLIEDLKDLTENIVLEAENNILQIAIAIAQKVLQKEISQDPEAIVGMVQEALKNLSSTEAALIRIHPQDIEMLMRKRPELLAAVEGVKLLKLEPDPTLLPGDCIVEGSDRMVDARLNSQLKVIQQKLISPLEEGKRQ